jgi:hypothetical protein
MVGQSPSSDQMAAKLSITYSSPHLTGDYALQIQLQCTSDSPCSGASARPSNRRSRRTSKRYAVGDRDVVGERHELAEALVRQRGDAFARRASACSGVARMVRSLLGLVDAIV